MEALPPDTLETTNVVLMAPPQFDFHVPRKGLLSAHAGTDKSRQKTSEIIRIFFSLLLLSMINVGTMVQFRKDNNRSSFHDTDASCRC